MRRHAPEVREYMTRLPVEAERCETVADAMAMMETHRIHHVPVMSGSQLKGIVSERDLLEAKSEQGDHFLETPLDQICKSDVLTVGPVDPIDEVARMLLDRRVGSAVVVDSGFVVGIFMTSDALRFVADFFGQPKSK
jgi:acetoin utilization protein AcuB